MKINYDYEPYISPEQDKMMSTLSELSSKYQEEITEKRERALSKLLNDSCSSDAKKEELNTFLAFRMNLDTSAQIAQIARTLCEDKSFYYNDSSLVLNNLDPFFENITLEDIILAYHNYRLSDDDESLSHFVKLIGLYATYAFEMDGMQISFPVPDGILTHNESLSHFGSIIQFVDKYLQKYGNKRDLFAKKYELKKETRIDFTSRIDEDAAQSFGKKSPLEIRMSKLIDYMYEHNEPDVLDSFYLEIILDKLYGKVISNHEINCDSLSAIQWPTLSDMFAIAEEKYEKEKQNDSFARKSYKHFIDILNSIRNKNKESEFNAQIAITEEDFTDAEKNNSEVEEASAFDNIQRSIRFLFFVILASKEIPAFSGETEKIKWREMIWRRLCDIYTDESAFEDITEEDEINKNRIIEKEKAIETRKNKLYKSFLMLYDSSAESIMENRIHLLDSAKAIAPEDISFLEKCSAGLLEKLQNAMQKDSLLPFENYVRKMLSSAKRIQLPDSVIHTLTTAEFLFDKYAKDEFSKQNFDYSSISALYYQAFENAYNELIWGKYADFLNHLEIEITEHNTRVKKKYTAILAEQHYKGHFIQGNPGYGYLPAFEKDWLHYSRYDKILNMTIAKSTITYGDFATLIGNMEPHYKAYLLPGFYDWFALELGFNNSAAMRAEIVFMRFLNQFRADLNATVPNRNNASHGGSEISKVQCSNDREAVLYDPSLPNLQRIRASSIGLILQLIKLFNHNP